MDALTKQMTFSVCLFVRLCRYHFVTSSSWLNPILGRTLVLTNALFTLLHLNIGERVTSDAKATCMNVLDGGDHYMRICVGAKEINAYVCLIQFVHQSIEKGGFVIYSLKPHYITTEAAKV